MKIENVSVNERSYKDRAYASKTRIYVWPKGESLLDNLQNRKTRPYSVFRKEVIPAVLAQLNLPSDVKVKWSQYAGCSCPCSPGFIVASGHYRHDVHVTVTE